MFLEKNQKLVVTGFLFVFWCMTLLSTVDDIAVCILNLHAHVKYLLDNDRLMIGWVLGAICHLWDLEFQNRSIQSIGARDPEWIHTICRYRDQ